MKQIPVIIANWKMNPASPKGAGRLFDVVKKEFRAIKNTEIVICPPYVWLSNIETLKYRNICLGAQDCFWENEGAFTGEVSPLMLKNAGCQYVIIGHSERRKYFQESDGIINKKLKIVLKNRLKPILCVGEEARDSLTEDGKVINEMSLVVGEQIKNGLSGIPSARVNEIVIAYEPIWAIGTGIPCSSDDAMKAALFIKKTLANLYNRSVAEKVRIVYGGSITSQNAADYIKEAGTDGLLVGGASLNASEFIKIVRNVKEVSE